MSQWVATVDKGSGKTYYYNKVTKVTQWSKPADYVEPTPEVADDPETNPANWAKAFHEASNREYYYNKKTKKTAWKRPACLGPEEPSAAAAAPATATATPATPAAAPAAAAPAGDAASAWRETKDPKTGKPYWYNKVTKQSSWKRPAELDNQPSSAPATAAVPTPAIVPAAVPAAAPRPDGPAAPSASSSRASAIQNPVSRSLIDDDAVTVGGPGASSAAAPAAEPGNAAETLVLSHESDSEEEAGELRFAAHRKGLVNRILRQKSKILSTEKLLSFKKSIIKKAILKQNRDLDEEAIQFFKNVMSYMGDRSSSKGPVDHAKKLLRNLLVAPSGLRDEVLIQLAKQTNNNPRLESTIKGWELMRYCLATFPPSKAIRTFLVDYLNKNATGAADATVRKMAQACQSQMEKIGGMGQRHQIPSKQELEALRTLSPVVLNIPLLDGTQHAIEVDSYTTVNEVEGHLIRGLQLSFTEPFALYEVGDANVERLLEGKERILDIVASWENEPPDAEDNKVGSKKGNEYTSLYSQLLYKAKLVLKLNVPDLANDPEAIKLLYIQAVGDVVTDRYPIKEKEAITLAAFQNQVSHGDATSARVDLGSCIKEYMPEALFMNEKRKPDPSRVDFLSRSVAEQWRRIVGVTALDARIQYLAYAQDATCYGATVFIVEQRLFKEYPSPLLLGTTCEGVLLMHPQKRTVLENYKYPDIVTWGHSDEKFILVVGNIVQQRKLVFKTNDGKTIGGLVHEYVRFKVRAKAGPSAILKLTM